MREMRSKKLSPLAHNYSAKPDSNSDRIKVPTSQSLLLEVNNIYWANIYWALRAILTSPAISHLILRAWFPSSKLVEHIFAQRLAFPGMALQIPKR